MYHKPLLIDGSDPKIKTNHLLNPVETTSNQQPLVIPSGMMIDDLSNICHIEDIEHVNDVQLYEILQNLKHMVYIRNFMVDLYQSCPFSPLQPSTSKNKHTTSANHHQPQEQTPTLTLPNDVSKKKSLSWSPSSQSSTVSSLFQTDSNNDDDDSSYQCSGGTVGTELDDDAEPLCSVQGADNPLLLPKLHPVSSTTSSTTNKSNKKASNRYGPLHSNNHKLFQSKVLNQLQQTGFTSQSQQDTFTWKDMTDTVFTEVTDTATIISDTSQSSGTTSSTSSSSTSHMEDYLNHHHNNTDMLLPDTFWDDMCSLIGRTNIDTSTMINLALNPERNTGYNGTHIWRAIYEENCIASHIQSSIDETSNTDTTLSFINETINTEKNMCYEERVLYRLLSGLHSSTTISIAKHYYPPSKKKNRTVWESNPQYYMDKFMYHPEYIQNLHFTYVVLLRALSKASSFLYNYTFEAAATTTSFGSHDIDVEEQEDRSMTQKLIRRLLDSSILQSCQNVFEAFDESVMFQEDTLSNSTAIDVASLRRNFKGVFHNISAIFDCVQCQQCKLHGKLVMLGYGAALKVLLMQNSHPHLDQNEIVALINTVIKFSESIRDVRELSNMYAIQQQQQQQNSLTTGSVKSSISNDGVVMANPSTISSTMPLPIQGTHIVPTFSVTDIDLIDRAVGVVAALGRTNQITLAREQELIELILYHRHTELLILVKHYQNDLDKFLQLSNRIRVKSDVDDNIAPASIPPDAIVIGSGLAGMATTLNILDRGGRVIIIEKEHNLGGNSGKASSGINACCFPNNTNMDTIDLFWNDTYRSAGTSANSELITKLVSNSANAVSWIKNRLGVDLSLVAQLGGHSTKRTHRPKNGMVGAEIIYAIQKAIKAYVPSNKVVILTDTKVTDLLTDPDGAVIGVECLSMGNSTENAKPFQLHAPNVVLATGGFAADRSDGSYLSQYRPELLRLSATAGPFSTGDGIKLATTLGAATIDMDKVQIHPTGWVDPTDPNSTSKILAGELMRGVGGILINDRGQRFCNELGTRAYVTHKMLEHDPIYAKTGNWSINATVPIFSMILSSSAAKDGKKHVDLYVHKGLLTRLDGIDSLANWLNIPRSTIVSTMKQYQQSASLGYDEFGKKAFNGVPATDLENETFYAGKVTPVLHYCMGGIAIDTEGNVLNTHGEIIPGLHAAGEVSGGVHGANRLGGNSLLECTVYGTIVGQKLPIHHTSPTSSSLSDKSMPTTQGDTKRPATKNNIISSEELQKHNTPNDCWIAIHGVVYDLTDFAEEHPAGAESIYELAGQDGTNAFATVHNPTMLQDFDEEVMGRYQP